MTEIADKCGFADSNTMGGTFKKIMGEAPGSYRKNH
ncbi:helix-turn-helix domain-containing protein [Lachnospira eligens]